MSHLNDPLVNACYGDDSSETDNDKKGHRPIRSFVLRQGRLTKGQSQALNQFWPTRGVDYQVGRVLDFTHLFSNTHPVTLEIGFGMGDSFIRMAQDAPAVNFVGIEVHLPGVGACLMAAEQAGVSNVRIIHHDAVEVLQQMIPSDSLACVQVFFPDPWHKARHNKRRIIQPHFVELVRQKLSIGGVLHLATDWQHYAEHMLSVMQAAPGYQNVSVTQDYVPRPANRPLTKFEQRGHRLGHGVWDLQFKRLA